jgi:hypothetical protein
LFVLAVDAKSVEKTAANYEPYHCKKPCRINPKPMLFAEALKLKRRVFADTLTESLFFCRP